MRSRERGPRNRPTARHRSLGSISARSARTEPLGWRFSRLLGTSIFIPIMQMIMQMSRLRRKQFIVSHEMNKQMARNSIEIKFILKKQTKVNDRDNRKEEAQTDFQILAPV